MVLLSFIRKCVIHLGERYVMGMKSEGTWDLGYWWLQIKATGCLTFPTSGRAWMLDEASAIEDTPCDFPGGSETVVPPAHSSEVPFGGMLDTMKEALRP